MNRDAVGTLAQPIVIRGATAGAGSWYGLSLEPGASASNLTYVQVSDAEIALWVRSTSAVTLADLRLSTCGQGVLLGCAPI